MPGWKVNEKALGTMSPASSLKQVGIFSLISNLVVRCSCFSSILSSKVEDTSQDVIGNDVLCTIGGGATVGNFQ